MHFIPRLTAFLCERGSIVTLREYKYSTERCFVPGVGLCHRRLLREFETFPSEHELAPHIESSGFVEVTDWLGALDRFLRGDHGKRIFMYEVEREKEEE